MLNWKWIHKADGPIQEPGVLCDVTLGTDASLTPHPYKREALLKALLPCTCIWPHPLQLDVDLSRLKFKDLDYQLYTNYYIKRPIADL